MNLQNEISRDLWDSVSSTYTAGNYTHSILEASHQLTSLLRNRAGVDGDGAALVGQALGGDTPRLRLNSLQTDSERNIQRGIEQIIRGVYLGIRNPRSHGAINDTKKVADSIIVFIDYIMECLGASKLAFTVEELVARLKDTGFVDSDRYAELLAAEIPTLRRGDAIIEIYRTRLEIDIKKTKRFISYLIGQLNDSQLTNYLSIVSDDLKTVVEDKNIIATLQMVDPTHWPRLNEISRIRIENRLLEGIRRGEILENGKVTEPLATWSGRFLEHFSTRESVEIAIVRKLEDDDVDDRNFVARYFARYIPHVIVSGVRRTRAIRAIANAIRLGDREMRSMLVNSIRSYPAEWQKELVEALKDQTNTANPGIVLDDGTPLLSALPEDDNIPF